MAKDGLELIHSARGIVLAANTRPDVSLVRSAVRPGVAPQIQLPVKKSALDRRPNFQDRGHVLTVMQRKLSHARFNPDLKGIS